MDNNNVNNNEQPTVVTPNNRFAISSDNNLVQNTVPVNSEPIITTPVNPEPVVQNSVPTNPEPVVQNTVPTNPEPVIQNTNPQMNIPNVNTPDSNAIVNENLKKVEINYTPPSKFKVVLLVLFFIALLGFIIFLPDISSLVSKYRSGNIDDKEEVITTGRLECSLSTNTANLDKEYDAVFKFTDSKLERTEFVYTTRGDVTLDEETLDKLANTCKQLKENVKSMQGVTIQCNYSDGKLEEIQSFDLSVIDVDKLGSAFTEAGGTNPTYQYGQDIDKIESNMKASNYTCKRVR